MRDKFAFALVSRTEKLIDAMFNIFTILGDSEP